MKLPRMKLLLTVTFVMTILLSIFFYTSAFAIRARTSAQLKQWLDNEDAMKIQRGNGSCVTFCNHYLTDFWDTPGESNPLAKDFRCPAGFTEVYPQNGGDLRMGDIIVEDWGDGVGHVSVYYGIEGSAHIVVDQATGGYSTPRKHQWWDVLINTTHVYRGPVDADVPGQEMVSKSPRPIPDGDYLIVPTAKQTMFLDIYGTDKAAPNGTKITLWERDGDPNECDIWTITYSNGYYTIKQKGTNKSLDVKEDRGSMRNKATSVIIWESTGASNQQWAISKNGTGYRIQARCSCYSLDVQNGIFSNDAVIQQWENNNSTAQIWSFLPYKNGKIAGSSTGTKATATPKKTAAPKATPTPTPKPTAQPKFAFYNDDKMFFVDDASAQIGYIRVTSTGNIGDVNVIGCELADEYLNVLSRHEESPYIQGNTIVHYFRVNADPNQSDIFYRLTPGTKYYLRAYVIQSGKTYYGGWREFITAIPAATQPPVVTEAPATTDAPSVTEVPTVTETPAVTEAPVVQENIFNFVDDGKMFFLNDTTAQFGYIRITGNVNINDVKAVGCELADSNSNILATHEEASWIQNNSIIHYFRVNGIPNESDIFYALKPGTSYRFRSYAVYNGKKYYSDWRDFTTTGNVEVSKPEIVPEPAPEQEPQAEPVPEQETEVPEVDSPAVVEVPHIDPIPETVVTSFEPYVAYTAMEKVNVREEPNPKGEKVTRLEEAGTQVTVYGEAFDKDGTRWLQVVLPTAEEGFIRADLLTTDRGSIATEAPVQDVPESVPEPLAQVSHAYQLFEDGMTWSEAERYCESLGGHLVTITSSDEQNEVNRILETAGKNVYWIGGYLSDGQWTWVTGEEWDYQNWSSEQPDNFLDCETALSVYRNANPNSPGSGLGRWNDLREDGNCNDEEFFGTENIGFICEWD